MSKLWKDLLATHFTPEQIKDIKDESQKLIDEVPPFNITKAIDLLFKYEADDATQSELAEMLRSACFEISRTRAKDIK